MLSLSRSFVLVIPALGFSFGKHKELDDLKKQLKDNRNGWEFRDLTDENSDGNDPDCPPLGDICIIAHLWKNNARAIPKNK